MLNQETKRRIDSARDILVGKVPDPKAQVEQITTALIYKFMDDMDKESEELGGAASFFVDGYQQYAWSKLLDPKLGGFERLTLYAESLVKMHQNSHLPQLFRDIFKDAFLPYRDPETLNLFLKEINGFIYDHSEKLGDAFEYLLSVMDSQGDAGQFRTPRHIIDFIVNVVDPIKEDTVLDPACGTAGFLISSYKHILKQNTVHRLGDQLTPEDKTQLMRHFAGYDISPDMVRLSLVNMYLHGFPSPNIHEYDTLTSEERWDETYDVIMANPPFMTPKGGIRPHKRFSTQANRSEVLFVDYIAEHLNIHGRAGVIVPEGIIFQSGNAYKALRKMLVEKYLWAVVSLPSGVFQPYSGVKTSILLMDKNLAKKANSILFVKVENDGFDLGAQRRIIEKSDLPQALAKLQQYKKALQNGESLTTISSEIEATDMVIIADKSQIAKNGDYNLSGERYRETLARLHQQWQTVELGEVCEINPKKSEIKSISPNTEVSFVPMSDLSEKKSSFEIKQTKKFSEVIGGYTYFSDNDVLLAKVTPCFENGKSGIARDLKNKIGFGSSEFIVLRSSEKIYPELVYYFVSSEKFRKLGKAQMTGTGGLQRLPTSFISKFQIPLPSLEIQQEIVAELNGYQKIIDGARQVVENWKPVIDVDSKWEKVKLGEVCVMGSGGTPSKSNPEFWTGNIPWVSSKDIKTDFIKDTEDHISELAIKESATKLVEENTLLCVVRSGILQHTFPVALTTRKMCHNQDIISISADKSRLDIRYLFYMFKAANKKILQDGIKSGVTVQSFHSGFFKSYCLPLPPLKIQKQIVAQIEEEHELVDANKRLLDIFEQKIKDKVAEVWEEEPQKPVSSQRDTSKQAQRIQQAEVEQPELGFG